ncbi:hypothetical protein CONLIGDRAFT_667383 [Coniochaeta ligniaria NRRL 30616]|uniref:Uncharacterized protein n=1 Tax=Coniochaeta ligniaria NRRL 30616 TaxID=1408157 RepID=A0A1J7JLF1_9PEZI|nr:hypothetical protein CONLIGDRAFT_667383 [Coniochaeta ligniaria NRRL 30616]
MAREKRIRPRPVVMLARKRVALDQPLPPTVWRRHEIPMPDYWKDFIDIFKNALGRGVVACSRVAEDPEIVLFIISWKSQEALDQFKASPEYAAILLFLGMIDPSGSDTTGATSSSPRTIQTVNFRFNAASYGIFLEGWLSIYTVTLPHPVTLTCTQKELFSQLEGPLYPRAQVIGSDYQLQLQDLPEATGDREYAYRGWVQEPRQLLGEGGEHIAVQDGVIFKKWLSKEAEEAWKTAIPGVEISWDDDLRGIGAIEAKEEHVDLVHICS